MNGCFLFQNKNLMLYLQLHIPGFIQLNRNSQKHINMYIFWLFTIECPDLFLFFAGWRCRRFHQSSRPNAINERTVPGCRSRLNLLPVREHKLGRFTKSRLKLFRLVWHYSPPVPLRFQTVRISIYTAIRRCCGVDFREVQCHLREEGSPGLGRIVLKC